MIARDLARDTATFSRFGQYRNSIPREMSSAEEAVMETMTTAAWEPVKQGAAAGSEVSVNADGGGTPLAKSRPQKRCGAFRFRGERPRSGLLAATRGEINCAA
jgi:hypothetical protein